MSQIAVNLWRQFGHHRAYFTQDGVKIGWLDLTNEVTVPVSDADAETLRLAVAVWRHHGEPASFTLNDTHNDGLAGAPRRAAAAPVDFLPPAWVPLDNRAPERVPTPTTHVPGEPDCDDSGWAVNRFASVVQPAPVDASHQPAVTASSFYPQENVDWHDLSANQAGAQAQQEADRLRTERPVHTFFARLLNANTDERAWRVGAQGERLVGAQLAKLVRQDPCWRVVHAVPVGERGSDIDHIAIGPSGVFAINAKHHPGAKAWVGGDTVMINGHRHPYVRNSRFEAARAAELLAAAAGIEVHVTGVIVFVNLDDLRIKQAPGDVVVVPRRQLRSYLRGGPQVLDSDHVAHLHEYARRSTTWQPASL